MTIPDRYDAFWIPGPDDLDLDDSLRLGYRWLDDAPYKGERVVVLNVKKLVNNRPTLAAAAGYRVVFAAGAKHLVGGSRPSVGDLAPR